VNLYIVAEFCLSNAVQVHTHQYFLLFNHEKDGETPSLKECW